jgi:DNA repair protein RadC
LGKYDLKDLTAFKGIGEAKAISIIAAMELGRRRREEDKIERPLLNSSRKVYDYMYQRVGDLPYEEFWALLLNRAGRLIEAIMVSRGGTASTVVDKKIILKAAIQNLASAIILCHNHPSGAAQPSAEDMRLTRGISEAARMIDINVLDHIIVCDNNYYSFADDGKMP